MRLYDIYRIIPTTACTVIKRVKTVRAKSQADAEKQIREPGVYVAAVALW